MRRTRDWLGWLAALGASCFVGIGSGVVTQRGGKATGARPGKLVRGTQGSQPKFGAAAN